MRRFGEYTPNRHNISVALAPHGMLNYLKLATDGETIINSENMYLVNLLPKRFRPSASPEARNQQNI